MTDTIEVQIEEGHDQMNFIMAGRALFTVVSLASGKRYTYQVKRVPNETEKYFVGLLTGPDNGADYTYIGFMVAGLGGWTIYPKKGQPKHPAATGLQWVMNNIGHEVRSQQFEIYHAGSCAACGRTLTDPESIRTGLGPICREKV